MDYLSLLSRLTLTVLLVAAAWGKLRAFSEFQHSLGAALELALWLRVPMATSIIAIEGALAVLLVANTPFQLLAMLATLVMFVVFALFIVLTLLRHRSISCHCFGQPEAPLSVHDVVRSLVLVLMSVLMLSANPPPSDPHWSLQALLWLLAFVLAWLLIYGVSKLKSRQTSSMSLPPLTLPVGEPIAQLRAQTCESQLPITFQDKPTVLTFLSSHCHTCHQKRPELTRILPALASADVDLWVVMSDTPQAIDDYLADTGLKARAVNMDEGLQRELNPRAASPFYLFIDQNRVLQASGIIGDADWQSFLTQMDEILTLEEQSA